MLPGSLSFLRQHKQWHWSEVHKGGIPRQAISATTVALVEFVSKRVIIWNSNNIDTQLLQYHLYPNRLLARWNSGIPEYSIRFFGRSPVALRKKSQGDDVLCEAPYGTQDVSTETNDSIPLMVAWLRLFSSMTRYIPHRTRTPLRPLGKGKSKGKSKADSESSRVFAEDCVSLSPSHSRKPCWTLCSIWSKLENVSSCITLLQRYFSAYRLWCEVSPSTSF